MRRLSLNRSEPAKKSGQNIPKNRCRTTTAERMVETPAELPFIGDQGRLLKPRPGRPQRHGYREGISSAASCGFTQVSRGEVLVESAAGRSMPFRRCSRCLRAIRANANREVSMAEPNPTTVIADCIEKSKGSTDPELISDYIAEALGVLQTDSLTEHTRG